MEKLPRNILPAESNQKVVEVLQGNLFTLIDVALQGKQAHWNVVGAHFRNVHLHLDEIIDSAREASDEVAERISTLGVAPDGRAAQVAAGSDLDAFPEGFLKVDVILKEYGDRLEAAVRNLRDGLPVLGEEDPISEDMIIGISADLEKHLWMWQAQEV